MSDRTSAPEKDGLVRVEKRSALPLWGAALVWAVFGLLLPMYMWYHYLAAAAVSAAVGLITAKFAPPVVSYEKAPVNTGDPALDEVLLKIDDVKTALAKAGSAGAASYTDSISLALEKIGKRLRSDPSQLDDARRLFTYYMPIIEKLSEKYVYFRESSDGEVSTPEQSAAEIENALAMISEAMQKYYDSMFEDEALDISTDIDVLEAMLKKDGLY